MIGVSNRCPFASIADQSKEADVLPPFKKHRDSLSVLRALASCVTPTAETPDFRLGGDPWLGSMPNTRNFLLARAKGRLAARLAIRDYFPNDIVAVAKEIPRVDRWLPLQTPDSVLKRVSDGELSANEGMDRLLLLMAPIHAWKLHADLAPNEEWSSEVLHRLLDLLCATNSGSGGAHNHSLLDSIDLATLPDPEELYFADELAIQFDRHIDRMSLGQRNPLNVSQQQAQQNTATDLDTSEDEGSSSESESDANENTETDVNQSVGRCSWEVQGPAEQLFTRAHTQLQTPAGFSSIIRGAAKFHHPRRALQLFESCTRANIGPLDTAVYASLIRCLHALPESEVRPQIEKIMKELNALEIRISLPLFEAALYCLAELVHRHSSSQQPVGDYSSFGLGLFNAIRKSGLEPSLGAMANLLRLLHFTPLQSANSVEYPRGYACSPLVDSFVSELERRFQVTCPTRLDGWSADDYNFFPIAMRIASMENNPKLGQRINQLLSGTQDRRFFLATSWHRRNYIQSYLLSQINIPNLSNEVARNPVELIQCIDQVYREHWSTLIITNQLCERFISFFERFFTLSNATPDSDDSNPSTLTRNEASKNARLLAFHCLHRLLIDLLDHPRSPSDTRLPKSVGQLIPVLAAQAHCDPTLSSQASSAVLKRLLQIDERQALISSRTGNENTSNRPSSANALSASNTAKIVCMLFPLLSRIVCQRPLDVSNHLAEVRWRRELIQTMTTLNGWVQYAVKHATIAWSWAPESLHLLWEHNETDFTIDQLWDALRALSQQELKNLNPDEIKRIEHIFYPLLASLESQVVASELASSHGYSDPGAQLVRAERRQIIARLKLILNNKRSTLSDGESHENQDRADG
ncbi:unnamed protein product [Echinostoma caproni]|uniref:RAP domain-containing protein n=1 Tax=Echinostoma caproni TaxID=27848 RepID=A0A183ABM2_9TREM|nr:unnamed protein product [Echinostoma caproni]